MSNSLYNKHRFAGSLIYGDRYFVFGQIYFFLLSLQPHGQYQELIRDPYKL